ncbi:MAG: 50S ribosomal protein L11 methyltransferase [Rhodocyclaceae bacterium]|nr:50S ribosomal protein L11 methyltransferase [Rhodocyclaceae bacterium]
MSSQTAWVSARIIAEARQAEALGDALMEAGALSVTVEDADAGTPAETPQYGEPGMETHTVWNRSVLSALFDAQEPVRDIVATCAAALGVEAELTIEEVPETDWVRATQAQFDPIPIGGPLWIVPTWHTPPDTSDKAINLVLDPGLAFGTGSHPTTRMCLQWLVRERPVGSVLDYGCGSGILAIAAAKLGACEVVGVDIDPQAVRSAHDNAEANTVTAAFFDASDKLPAPYDLQTYDVVLANILANPLRILAPALTARLKPGASLVLAGLLAEQAEELIGIYRPWLEMRVADTQDGWSLLVGSLRK